MDTQEELGKLYTKMFSIVEANEKKISSLVAHIQYLREHVPGDDITWFATPPLLSEYYGYGYGMKHQPEYMYPSSYKNDNLNFFIYIY